MTDVEITKLSEKFVEFIKENGVDVGLTDIPSEFLSPRDVLQNIQTKLIQAGCLYIHLGDDNQRRYALTEKGQRFTSFEDLKGKQDKKDDLDEKIKKLSLTNAKNQRIIAWVALGISICSLSLSAFSAFQNYSKPQTKSDTIVIKNLDNLMNMQKESSIKTVPSDSIK